MAETYSAGIVTAYGAAVRGGYTGTYEQWCQDMANLGDNVAEVRTKAAQAAQSAENAAGSATAAAESATAAAGSATNAASSAAAASASATAAGNAQTAAETAQGKAEDAQEAAEQAQSDAEAAAQSVSQSAAQISQNTSDIGDLKSAVNDPTTGLDSKAPVIIDTASGSIASFPDGADGMPLKSLLVSIEPVQAGSGDPSSENVRPISGWTGIKLYPRGSNLLRFADIDPVPRDWTGNPTTDATKSTSALIYNAGYYNISVFFDIPPFEIAPNSSITISADVLLPSKNGLTNRELRAILTDGTVSAALYSSVAAFDKVSRLVFRFNYNSGFTAKRFCIQPGGNAGAFQNLNCQVSNIAIEFGDTPGIFTGYGREAINITFPTEAGTVYGGTLTINEDGTGELTTDWIFRTYTGDEEWYEAGSTETIKSYFVANQIPPQPNNATVIDAKSSIAVYGELTAPWECKAQGFIGTYGWIGFSCGADVPDVASFKALLRSLYSNGTPAQIACKLRTSETYQLTAQQVLETLYGTNNIWTDCGDVEVEYRADTKLYIQKINAPSDDDMTADTQIANGRYFIIGNNLYLSTTTIPAGDTIIPGTNCTKTNLAEALNALNV